MLSEIQVIHFIPRVFVFIYDVITMRVVHAYGRKSLQRRQLTDLIVLQDQWRRGGVGSFQPPPLYIPLEDYIDFCPSDHEDLDYMSRSAAHSDQISFNVCLKFKEKMMDILMVKSTKRVLQKLKWTEKGIQLFFDTKKVPNFFPSLNKVKKGIKKGIFC